jgi:hypothetical protein
LRISRILHPPPSVNSIYRILLGPLRHPWYLSF